MHELGIPNHVIDEKAGHQDAYDDLEQTLIRFMRQPVELTQTGTDTQHQEDGKDKSHDGCLIKHKGTKRIRFVHNCQPVERFWRP